LIQLNNNQSIGELEELIEKINLEVGGTYASLVFKSPISEKTWIAADDVIILKLKKGATKEGIQEKIGKESIEYFLDRTDGSNIISFKLSKGVSSKVLEIANELFKTGAYEFVEPNFWFGADQHTNYFDKQWYLNNTGQVFNQPNYGGCYDISATGTTGSDISPSGFTGQGIKVAIIDDGVDVNHPEFGNIGAGYDAVFNWDQNSNGGALGAQDTNGEGVWGSGTIDKFSHGTGCAGLVFSADDGQGIKGVAPNSTLIPVRIYYPLNAQDGLGNDCSTSYITTNNYIMEVCN